MGDLIGKLSTYQIFGSIVPGSLFLLLTCWLWGFSVASDDLVPFILVAYFCGLVMNRLGAITAIPFERRMIAGLFAIYERTPSARATYDNFVMYRTLVVAMLACGAAVWLRPTKFPLPFSDRIVIVDAVMLAVVFAGAAILQLRYLRLLIKEPPEPGATTAS